MRHDEIETEPYYPLEEMPTHKKTRRHRDPEYEGLGRKKPKFKSNSLVIAPDEIKQIIVETPNIDSLKEEFKPFSLLISHFVSKNGHQAVTRRVLKKLGPTAISSNFESNPHIREIIAYASGTAFERLAHLYLKDIVEKKSKDKKRVLDPGSTSRTFQSLRDFDGSINFAPDGIVIINFPYDTTLSGLCEYKLSPYRNIDDLIGQIRTMRDFINRFSGQNLRINTRRDNGLGNNHKTIKVDNRPNIHIVIPDNSFPNIRNISCDPCVNVHVAPFPRDLPIRLAVASLKDFGEVFLQA